MAEGGARKYSVQLIVLAVLLLAHYGPGKTHILPHALVVPLLAIPVAYFATVLGWKALSSLPRRLGARCHLPRSASGLRRRLVLRRVPSGAEARGTRRCDRL